MLHQDLYLLGAGAELGTLVPVSELGDEALQRRMTALGQQSISIAHDTAGPDMAVHAAREALAVAATVTGVSPLPVPTLHLHASIWRGGRGYDFWSVTSYVRRHLGMSAGPQIPLEINAMSNSMVLGIDLAARLLHGSPDIETALLTGAERFGAPAFDHLTADRGIVYGDGASSVVIGRQPGLARILSTSSTADPNQEALHRGARNFHAPGAVVLGVTDVAGRKREYLKSATMQDVLDSNALGVAEAVNTALDEAGTSIDRVPWILTPFYGRPTLIDQCLVPLGIQLDRTLHDVGGQWGHLGPHDQIAGLVHLLSHSAVRPGDHVLLVGIGVGLTWTAALLEVLSVPSPSRLRPLPLRQPWRDGASSKTRM